MLEYDYDQAIEIAEGVYWIGHYNEKATLICNPYLIMEDDESIIIDPGSVLHFPVVARKIVSLIQPERISHIILSHHDPDSCSSLPILEKLIGRHDLKLVAHRKASIFVAYYGVSSSFLHPEENGHHLILRSGREIQFVSTPHSHAPGAIMTYDTRSKILFSTHVFSGISVRWKLFAENGYERDVIRFSQAYFPPSDAVRKNLTKIESLDISMIAPQHGSIIQKEEIPKYIELLKNLECGTDLQEAKRL